MYALPGCNLPADGSYYIETNRNLEMNKESVVHLPMAFDQSFGKDMRLKLRNGFSDLYNVRWKSSTWYSILNEGADFESDEDSQVNTVR